MINRVVKANLFHRRMRTALAVLAIGMEVAMILLIFGLADGLVGESTRRQRGIGADILIRPSTSTGALFGGAAGLEESLLEKLEALPGVRMVVGTAFTMPEQLQTVTGVDLDKFARMSGGLRFLEGRSLEGPFDMVVDHVYARQNKLSVGDTVRVLNHDFRVVGIVEAGKLSRIFVPLETIQDLMGWQGKLSQIYVKLDDPSRTSEMIARLEEMLPENPIWSMEEFISLFMAQTRGRGDDFVKVIVAIAIVVGFIVVLMSMYTAVLERTRDIGILKALGASPGYIVDIFMRETLMLTVSGILVGIGLAYAAQAAVEEHFPLVVITIERGHLIWALVIALVGALLGSFYPALRAARQDAISALAYE